MKNQTSKTQQPDNNSLSSIVSKFNVTQTFQFAEWIAERYNYIGGEYCCWCAKQYDTKDVERYKHTGELFAYWAENCRYGLSSMLSPDFERLS